MKLKILAPVEPNTPQDHMAKVVATILTVEGIDDMAARPLAVSIFKLLENAKQFGVKNAVQAYINQQVVAAKTMKSHNHHNLAAQYRRMASSLGAILNEIP